MAILSPTIATGLSQSYAVNLPGLVINTEIPRSMNIQRTIAGSAVLSVWAGDIIGEQREVPLTLREDTYAALSDLKAVGLYEMLLRINGKIFTVYFDIISALPNAELKDHVDLILRFTFTGEVTGK